MKRYLSVLLFLLLALVGRAEAMTPETGIWWNPSASGSGYGIEIQDNVLVISMWVYAPNGAPIYYISAGPMTGDSNYSGSLVTYSGGQCVGCPYSGPPTTVPFGSITVSFNSPSTGSVTINGGAAIPIQRFAYAIDMQSPAALFGEWALVEGTQVISVYFGERIQFNTTTTSSGIVYAAGQRSGSASNLAVGNLSADGYWYVLLDSSTSYYNLSKFRFSGLNAVEGTSWTYLKTSSPSGSGLPFIGFRSRSASVVKTGVGPGISTLSAKRPSIVDDAAIEAQNSLRATAPENTDGQPVPEEALNAHNILRGLLP